MAYLSRASAFKETRDFKRGASGLGLIKNERMVLCPGGEVSMAQREI